MRLSLLRVVRLLASVFLFSENKPWIEIEECMSKESASRLFAGFAPHQRWVVTRTFAASVGTCVRARGVHEHTHAHMRVWVCVYARDFDFVESTSLCPYPHAHARAYQHTVVYESRIHKHKHSLSLSHTYIHTTQSIYTCTCMRSSPVQIYAYIHHIPFICLSARC